MAAVPSKTILVDRHTYQREPYYSILQALKNTNHQSHTPRETIKPITFFKKKPHNHNSQVRRWIIHNPFNYSENCLALSNIKHPYHVVRRTGPRCIAGEVLNQFSTGGHGWARSSASQPNLPPHTSSSRQSRRNSPHLLHRCWGEQPALWHKTIGA